MKEIILLKLVIGLDRSFVSIVMIYYLHLNVFDVQNQSLLMVLFALFFVLFNILFYLENSLTVDGIGSIRYVEHNDLYWHSDCCVCVTCLQSLIGHKFYQDQIYNQLFCLQHIPNQYL